MIFEWPFRAPFIPQQMGWGAQSQSLISESALSGAIQTVGVPGKRWNVGLVLSARSFVNRSHAKEIEGFLDSLNGHQHRVTLFNMTCKGLNGYGTPSGTINLDAVTVSANAAQFATSLVLAGCGAGATMMAGDMLKVNGMLIMCQRDTVANGSGVMTILVSNGLRKPVTSGMAVTLYRPTGTFVMASNAWEMNYTVGQVQPVGIDFTEVFE